MIVEDAGQVVSRLRTPPGHELVHVTPAMLARVPEVPGVTWEQVIVHKGDTDVDFTLRLPANGPKYYRGPSCIRSTSTCGSPRSASTPWTPTARSSSRTTWSTCATCTARVKGDHGEPVRFLPSRIGCDAVLDFRYRWYCLDRQTLSFKIDFHRIDLLKLPNSWHLPPAPVRVNGHADLEVILTPEPPELLVQDRTLGGQPPRDWGRVRPASSNISGPGLQFPRVGAGRRGDGSGVQRGRACSFENQVEPQPLLLALNGLGQAPGAVGNAVSQTSTQGVGLLGGLRAS